MKRNAIERWHQSSLIKFSNEIMFVKELQFGRIQ